MCVLGKRQNVKRCRSLCTICCRTKSWGRGWTMLDYQLMDIARFCQRWLLDVMCCVKWNVFVIAADDWHVLLVSYRSVSVAISAGDIRASFSIVW